MEIKIEHEESKNLERLHYCVESRAHLIERLYQGTIVPENRDTLLAKYMEEYESYFAEYSRAKNAVEKKYRPEGAKSWTLDFETDTLTFEV